MKKNFTIAQIRLLALAALVLCPLSAHAERCAENLRANDSFTITATTYVRYLGSDIGVGSSVAAFSRGQRGMSVAVPKNPFLVGVGTDVYKDDVQSARGDFNFWITEQDTSNVVLGSAQKVELRDSAGNLVSQGTCLPQPTGLNQCVMNVRAGTRNRSNPDVLVGQLPTGEYDFVIRYSNECPDLKLPVNLHVQD